MKKHVRIILKSGNEFVMICGGMTATRSKITGELEGIKYEGCTENRPLYLDLTQVAAVIEENV